MHLSWIDLAEAVIIDLFILALMFMKWLKRIKKSDWLIIASFYVIALLVEVPLDLADAQREGLDESLFIIFFNDVLDYCLDILVELIVVFGIFSHYFMKRKYVLAILSVVLVLIIQAFIQPILIPKIYDAGLPLHWEHLLTQLSNNALSISLVGLLLIAKQFYESRHQIIELQKEKKESELKWLKAQVDPHFLFNNLNILDILINSDPAKASIYNRRLSSLYRYMLRHKDQDVVSLSEEIKFCKDYIYLLQQRFDELFHFQIKLKEENIQEYMIPPAALQTLLENIVKHNKPLPNQPIEVTIEVLNEKLIIENTLRRKYQNVDSTGTGLENLSKRLKLLSNSKLEIIEGETKFTVKVPLIKNLNYST